MLVNVFGKHICFDDDTHNKEEIENLLNSVEVLTHLSEYIVNSRFVLRANTFTHQFIKDGREVFFLTIKMYGEYSDKFSIASIVTSDNLFHKSIDFAFILKKVEELL